MSYHSYDNRRRPAHDFVGPNSKKPRMNPRMPNPAFVPQDDTKRLLSFKEFVLNQHDGIEESDACTLYKNYKLEYKRGQIEKFFDQHKDEEWFKNKYRPPEKNKIAEDLKDIQNRRKEIYNQLKDRQLTEGINVTYDEREKLTKFLNKFCSVLEGAPVDEVMEEDIPQLYATSSLFIPQLHPSVDKESIEAFAKTHEGFLRVAIAEPSTNDKTYRMRAWVTYKQMDKNALQRLCWEFNKQKFSGQETKAFPNKELDNRIRCSSYWFCHKIVADADLRQLARLLTHFEGDDCSLLEKLKDHLVREENAEEALQLGNEEESRVFRIEQDEELLRVLDEVILYLRVVYSYDYYSATDFSGEDDMPQRIGVMFARPKVPVTSIDSPEETLKEFVQAQDLRLKPLLEPPTVPLEELKSLGYRNPADEVENFITSNIHPLADDKYLVKLSGKRFLSPEFCRKHIVTRFANLIEDTQNDAMSFNNFVADPKRPM